MERSGSWKNENLSVGSCTMSIYAASFTENQIFDPIKKKVHRAGVS